MIRVGAFEEVDGGLWDWPGRELLSWSTVSMTTTKRFLCPRKAMVYEKIGVTKKGAAKVESLFPVSTLLEICLFILLQRDRK